jgi:preprotein translocase subunit SecB
MTDQNTQGVQDKPAQQFAIQKVYMKDMSFETPNSPTIFTSEWKPEINLQLTSDAKPVSNGVFEVVLSVTVTAKLADKTAYLAEVQQAGIFTVNGFEEGQQGPMLGAFCPNVLYPFAREAVADLIGKGGFPPVYLAPVNFDALYAQKMQEVNAQVATGSQGGAAH